MLNHRKYNSVAKTLYNYKMTNSIIITFVYDEAYQTSNF